MIEVPTDAGYSQRLLLSWLGIPQSAQLNGRWKKLEGNRWFKQLGTVASREEGSSEVHCCLREHHSRATATR